MKKRSPVAACLSNPAYRKRVVKARKGKGSYDRKQPKGQTNGE